MTPLPLHNRRSFIKTTALAGMAVPFTAWCTPFSDEESSNTPTDAFSIHLFSKHLQFLEYEEMAARAAEMGFDGLDLTVRPGGHVLPENVETDLPKAVAAIKKAGLSPLMMTTAIDEVNPLHQRVLETASAEGIEYYRANWFRYPDEGSIPEAIQAFREKLAALADLNVKLNLTGAYQNHAGRFVGASLWEVYEMLKDADPEGMGVQYDIRHATVEGGLSWPTELRLIASRIKSIVIKDFKWVQKNGKWKVENVPLGQGMVDFPAYFKAIRSYGIKAPISLHLEYDLGGAQSGKKEITKKPEEIYSIMKRDLQQLRSWLTEYQLVSN